MELNLSDNLDLTDIGVYPLTVNTLRLDMGASAKGQAFEILVPGFEAVYSAGGGSVAGIEAAQGVRVYPNPVKAGEAVTVEADGEANVQILLLVALWQRRLRSTVQPLCRQRVCRQECILCA